MAQHTASTTSQQETARGWVGSILGLVALVLAVLAALVLIVVPLATGSHTYSVLTSSMRPHLPPGTMLVSRPVPFASLKAGDVITYQLESGHADVISHRIVSTTPDQQGNTELITQGDNNDFPDEAAVREVQVRGKLLYAVPYAGFLANWLGNQNRGLGAQIAAVVLIAYGALNVTGGFVSRRRKAGAGSAPAPTPTTAAPVLLESAANEDGQQQSAVPEAIASEQVPTRLPLPVAHQRAFGHGTHTSRPAGRRRREKVSR